VALYSTPQPFGGVRWWFLCPLTGRRATKLVLPRGGHRFACRRAWSLGYRCQRSGKLDLISQRANKLHRALGGTGWWRDGIPPKPKWMRWPTYTQKARALRDLVGQFNATWAAGVMRRFPQL
jgi:hypothetical protein